MAIQMRRGNKVDFNPSKMLPGEWAISQDTEQVYMCYSPGRVVEIGSASAMIPYIEEAEAWARGTKNSEPVTSSDPQFHNNSKYYSEQASDSATNAATSETNAATSEGNAAASEDNSEAWAIGTTDTSHPAYNNSAKDWANAAAAIVGIGVATPTTPGIVKPDDTTIKVDGAGTISATSQITISGKKVVVL